MLQMTPTKVADAIGLFLGLRIVSQTQTKGSPGYMKAWTASPINHVTTSAAPFLLLHGDADESVPFKQSEIMEEALRKVNVPVTLIRIPNGGHGAAFPGGHIPPDLNEQIVNWLGVHLQRPK
jgi:dipeptidyl aminopeptidase/acylaminoacyl peptidase